MPKIIATQHAPNVDMLTGVKVVTARIACNCDVGRDGGMMFVAADV